MNAIGHQGHEIVHSHGGVEEKETADSVIDRNTRTTDGRGIRIVNTE